MAKQKTIEVLSVPDTNVGNMDCEGSISISDKQWQEAYKKGYNRAMLDYGLEYDEKPCEDCISKTDILGAVGHGTTYTSEEIQEIINRLPSVAPTRARGKMTLDEAVKVMQNEQTCVKRQGTPQRDRICAMCDLLLPTKDVLTAYDMAISALEEATEDDA